MVSVKEVGLKCYNYHHSQQRDKRNEKLVELQVMIRERLGYKYISYKIRNTKTGLNGDGGVDFPYIDFSIRKNVKESVLDVGMKMKELFEINSIPPMIFWGDEECTVRLDISEYWKNLLVDGISTNNISPELIDVFNKIEYDEYHALSEDLFDLIFLLDSYDMLLENFEVNNDEQEVAKNALIEFSKKKREWLLSLNDFLRPYEDLSYDERKVLNDATVKRMNEYINWHFAEIIQL